MNRIACYLLLLVASAGAVRAQPATDRLARGDSLYHHFDNEAALGIFETYYQQHPHDYDALERMARIHNELGLALLDDGEKDAAQDHFERGMTFARDLVAAYPDRPGAHHMLAVTTGNLALFRGGRAKVRLGRGVEEQEKAAIALDSTYAEAYIVLGVFYREVASLSWIERLAAKALFGGIPPASYDDAVGALGTAIRLDATLVLAHFELANTLIALDRDDEARQQYQLVLGLHPTNSQERRAQDRARAWLATHGEG